MVGARRWFNKLTTALDKWGFEPNKYNECCWNKMVDCDQVIVVFHVDDLKCLSRNNGALDMLFNDLNNEFGKEQELERVMGPVHDYLGLRIDYLVPSKCIFTMFNYIEDIVAKALDDLKPKNYKYLSNDKLFHVDERSPKLLASKADLFHWMVARILYASHRARPNVAVTTAFLCSRVKSPTKEDYKKLG